MDSGYDKGKQILIVDDEPDILELLEEASRCARERLKSRHLQAAKEMIRGRRSTMRRYSTSWVSGGL